jgi:hypothetical protein
MLVRKEFAMMRRSCSLLILLLVWSSALVAQIPRTLSYQGMLTDTLGASKPDGNYDLTFRLFDSENGGSALWTEAKSLTVKRGLFSTQLGDAVSFGSSVKFDKPYWLSVQVGSQAELAPRVPLSAVAYSLNTPIADSARIAGTVPNNTITSAKIQNGTIQLADLGQNGASEGQVLKWSSGAWAVGADEVGSSGTAGGWTDVGTTVRLSTATDTVALNTTSRLGKLNVNGDIGMNGESSLFFGTTNSYLGASAGENLMLRANNDLKLYAAGGLTALAQDNINIGHFGDETWIKVDNTNKRMGIGMQSSTSVDDRFHVRNDLSTPCWLRIESAHPSNWGQAGLRIKTPQNMWNLRMDLYSNVNLPNGALSLHSQDANKEVMTWLEDGRVGIGTTSPRDKLHVDGSARVEDTLFTHTVVATSIVGQPGLAHSAWSSYRGLGKDRVTVFDTVTIQTPGPGYILLLLSGRLQTDHTWNETVHASWGISTNPDTLGLLTVNTWQNSINDPSCRIYRTGALHTVVRVPARATYTYYAVGVASWNCDDYIKIGPGEFTALYIPVAYGDVESSSAGIVLPEIH